MRRYSEIAGHAVMRRLDRVVCAPEDERGEELLAVDVARERRRLSNERPDDVPIVDAMKAVPEEALAAQLAHVGEVDLDARVEDTDGDGLSDEPRGHGVRAVLHADGAPRADDEVGLHELREALGAHDAHRVELFAKASAPRRVGLADHVVDEVLPCVNVGEVAAAAEQERLLESPLERAVARLDVAVLLLLSESPSCAASCRSDA